MATNSKFGGGHLLRWSWTTIFVFTDIYSAIVKSESALLSQKSSSNGAEEAAGKKTGTHSVPRNASIEELLQCHDTVGYKVSTMSVGDLECMSEIKDVPKMRRREAELEMIKEY